VTGRNGAEVVVAPSRRGLKFVRAQFAKPSIEGSSCCPFAKGAEISTSAPSATQLGEVVVAPSRRGLKFINLPAADDADTEVVVAPSRRGLKSAIRAPLPGRPAGSSCCPFAKGAEIRGFSVLEHFLVTEVVVAPSRRGLK